MARIINFIVPLKHPQSQEDADSTLFLNTCALRRSSLSTHDMSINFPTETARSDGSRVFLFQAPPKQIPRTLENTREYDETIVEAGDEEVDLDDQTDEFASYFNKEYVPKILLTTVDKPRGKTIKFCRELELVLPNTEFKYRNYAHIKKTIPKAIEKGFTDFVGESDVLMYRVMVRSVFRHHSAVSSTEARCTRAKSEKPLHDNDVFMPMRSCAQPHMKSLNSSNE